MGISEGSFSFLTEFQEVYRSAGACEQNCRNDHNDQHRTAVGRFRFGIRNRSGCTVATSGCGSSSGWLGRDRRGGCGRSSRLSSSRQG